MSDKKKKPATFRMIEFAIWDDPRIRGLSDRAFRALMWLRTTRNTTSLPGLVFEAHAPNLQYALGLDTASEAEEVFRELECAHLIVRDHSAAAVYVPGVVLRREEGPHGPQHIQGYTSLFQRLSDDCPFLPILYAELKKRCDPDMETELTHVLEVAGLSEPDVGHPWPLPSPHPSPLKGERRKVKGEKRKPHGASAAEGVLPTSQNSVSPVRAVEQKPAKHAAHRDDESSSGKSTIIENLEHAAKAKSL